VHKFQYCDKCYNYPVGNLALDSAGNIYGTLSTGGKAHNGGVFRIDTASYFKVIYDFPPPNPLLDPPPVNANPGVFLGADGGIYGITAFGGVNGMIYKLDPHGHETALYEFPGATGGTYLEGNVIERDGFIYDTAFQGGAYDAGVLFRVDRAGRETILHTFTGGADGAFPEFSLAADNEGGIYGTTNAGGIAPPGSWGFGVVYKVSAAGQETVLHAFTGGEDGAYPGGVILADGKLYGTTGGGGAYGGGVAYEMDESGRETVLHSFGQGADGLGASGLIRDEEGSLYGTTAEGGADGYGTVFRIDPMGNEKVLFNFPGGPDGAQPETGVVRDAAGNLYGTTQAGGGSEFEAGQGVVFEITAAGTYKVIYTFPGGLGGGFPFGNLAGDGLGDIYGTADCRGDATCAGLVYEVTPTGAFTLLYEFTGGEGGLGGPGLALTEHGDLLGTALGGARGGGVLYHLSPPNGESPARPATRTR
jgi:uncharacterized repeat protein (TIGR03803 family)